MEFMTEPSNNADKPTSRRHFFRDGLTRLLRNAVEVMEEKLEQVRQSIRVPLDEVLDQPPSDPPRAPLLRPPGALPEEQLHALCDGCGKCSAVCPPAAIYLAYEGDTGQGRPVISPLKQPCILCESLACMPSCPTGVLAPTRREAIRMGYAEVDDGACLRTRGDDCVQCLRRCPLGESVIHLDGGPRENSSLAGVVVERDKCTGCGMCEHYCPVYPRAIRVQSYRRR